MVYTFEERIPDRSDAIFVKFYEDTKTPWRRVINWTYDPLLKRRGVLALRETLLPILSLKSPSIGRYSMELAIFMIGMCFIVWCVTNA